MITLVAVHSFCHGRQIRIYSKSIIQTPCTLIVQLELLQVLEQSLLGFCTLVASQELPLPCILCNDRDKTLV